MEFGFDLIDWLEHELRCMEGCIAGVVMISGLNYFWNCLNKVFNCRFICQSLELIAVKNVICEQNQLEILVAYSIW